MLCARFTMVECNPLLYPGRRVHSAALRLLQTRQATLQCQLPWPLSSVWTASWRGSPAWRTGRLRGEKKKTKNKTGYNRGNVFCPIQGTFFLRACNPQILMSREDKETLLGLTAQSLSQVYDKVCSSDFVLLLAPTGLLLRYLQ